MYFSKHFLTLCSSSLQQARAWGGGSGGNPTRHEEHPDGTRQESIGLGAVPLAVVSGGMGLDVTCSPCVPLQVVAVKVFELPSNDFTRSSLRTRVNRS